jgi:outer membrane receptor protein involved in Fe transport
LDPRFYADYIVVDGINVYASAAKGFRSGGTNGFGEPSFGPEQVWTYELGTKTSLLGRQLSAGGAIFYSRYTDYQINGLLPPPNPPLNVTSNGGDAWIKGVEWELTWHPTELWSLSFNGNLLDTRFFKVNTLLNPDGTSSSAYQVGDGLDLVPKHTLTVWAERDFTVNGKKGFVRLDYSQQGRETYRNRSIWEGYFGETKNINMLNCNTSLQWTDRLSFSVFAQNLLNDQNFNSPTYIEQAGKPRPRTYGLEFSMRVD